MGNSAGFNGTSGAQFCEEGGSDQSPSARNVIASIGGPTRAQRRAQAPNPNPQFRQITSATEIPKPKGKNSKGEPQYTDRQITELVYKDWKVDSLQSHAGHACRIKAYLGEVLKFTGALGWVLYPEHLGHWEMDDKNHSSTTAKVAGLSEVIRQEAGHLFGIIKLLAGAGRETDVEALSTAAGAHMKFARAAEDTRFIDSSIKQAAGVLKVDRKIFDSKPNLLGFKNGVWDKGQWRPGRREDYLLFISPVSVDFNASRDEWYSVLDRITKGDLEFARSLQEFCGYVLSGASNLRLLFWLYGPKGTGKSTIIELLSSLLGTGDNGLAETIDSEKFSGRGARERLGAQAYNKRLLSCNEAGNQEAEAELLKTYSGGDSIPARFLFKESFTFKPSHVLVMVANDAPNLNAYDEALKDRIFALPCNHALSDGEPLKLTGSARIETVRQDPESPLLLGFTAWVLEGLERVFLTQEVYKAPVINQGTAKFWQDTDPLTEFWQDIAADSTIMEVLTKADKKFGFPKGALRNRYQIWAEAEGRKPFGGKRWTQACESVGITENRVTDGRFWTITDQEKWATATQNHLIAEEKPPKMTGSDENDKYSAFFENLYRKTEALRPEFLKTPQNSSSRHKTCQEEAEAF